MLTKSERNFSIIFVLIVITDFICNSIIDLASLRYITKPAILTSLIIFFWRNSTHLLSKTRNLMLIALVFSLLGDVLLMFVHKSTNFFMGGLIAFLTAHIMYIFVFLKNRNREINTILFTSILLIYGAAIFYFLHDGLGKLFIPVLVYMTIILLMVNTAFLRKGSVPITSYNLVLIGAILFMISDSLLAINKFHQPIYLAHVSIILTYALAQLFIVFGIKRQR